MTPVASCVSILIAKHSSKERDLKASRGQVRSFHEETAAWVRISRHRVPRETEPEGFSMPGYMHLSPQNPGSPQHLGVIPDLKEPRVWLRRQVIPAPGPARNSGLPFCISTPPSGDVRGAGTPPENWPDCVLGLFTNSHSHPSHRSHNTATPQSLGHIQDRVLRPQL